MAEHASAGPARGYSWAPFEDGNEAALKHGADSERRWRPVAERLAAELLAERPWLANHRRTVEAWASVQARIVLIGNWLDRVGLWDDDGELRKALERLDRLEVRAQSLRADLALDPMPMARLLGTLTSTAATAGNEDVVAALAAEGRALVEAWMANAGKAPGSPQALEPPAVDGDSPDGANRHTDAAGAAHG